MIPLNRVLLVDDDAVTNLIHRRALEKSGCALQIDVARDGQQALDLLRADLAAARTLPELVFLDVNMPVMGGFEFLEGYTTLGVPSHAQMIVLMLSTPLLQADHARAVADANVACLLDKPLQRDKLPELVNACRRRRVAA